MLNVYDLGVWNILYFKINGGNIFGIIYICILVSCYFSVILKK